MKLNTVNVVEVNDFIITQILAFTDDEQGNKEAEKAFRKIAKKKGDDNIEVSLEDGYYKDMDYCVYIVHSA